MLSSTSLSPHEISMRFPILIENRYLDLPGLMKGRRYKQRLETNLSRSQFPIWLRHRWMPNLLYIGIHYCRRPN